MLKKTSLTIALLSLAVPAFADHSKFGLFYIANSELDLGRSEIDGDGIGLYGQHKFNDKVSLNLEYSTVNYDEQSGSNIDPDLDFRQARLGLTTRHSFTSSSVSSLFIAEVLNFDFVDVESEAGAGLHLGLNYQPTDAFALYGTAGYVWVDDIEGAEYKLGVSIRATREFSVFIDYRASRFSDDGSGVSLDMDIDDIRVGAAVHF